MLLRWGVALNSATSFSLLYFWALLRFLQPLGMCLFQARIDLAWPSRVGLDPSDSIVFLGFESTCEDCCSSIVILGASHTNLLLNFPVKNWWRSRLLPSLSQLVFFAEGCLHVFVCGGCLISWNRIINASVHRWRQAGNSPAAVSLSYLINARCIN